MCSSLPGGFWQCPQTFLVVTRGAPVYWVGARDAAKHPTMQRTVPKLRVLQLKPAKVRRLRMPVTAPSRAGLHGGGVEAVVLKKKKEFDMMLMWLEILD